MQTRREARQARRRALTLMSPTPAPAAGASLTQTAAEAPAATAPLAPTANPFEPLNAAEINDEFFKGRASERWVADKMPASLAFKIGKERHWHRHAVEKAVMMLAGAA